MIPKIIHQIWLPTTENKPLPDQYKNYCAGWANLNPSFKYKFWNENIYSELGGKDYIFEKYKLEGVHPAQVSDILRLLIIQKMGGLYIDIDVECFQCVDGLMVNEFLTYSYGYDMSKMILAFDWWASVPNHRLLERILQQIEEHLDEPIDLMWKYGFRRFQNEVVLGMDKDVTVYGARTIAPYLKHHFYNSWCRPIPTS